MSICVRWPLVALGLLAMSSLGVAQPAPAPIHQYLTEVQALDRAVTAAQSTVNALERRIETYSSTIEQRERMIEHYEEIADRHRRARPSVAACYRSLARAFRKEVSVHKRNLEAAEASLEPARATLEASLAALESKRSDGTYGAEQALLVLAKRKVLAAAQAKLGAAQRRVKAYQRLLGVYNRRVAQYKKNWAACRDPRRKKRYLTTLAAYRRRAAQYRAKVNRHARQLAQARQAVAKARAALSQAEAALADYVDDAPPTLTAEVSPAPNAAGWHLSDVTVRFSADDAKSGVASVSDPVVLVSDGEHAVTGTATDRAGNQTSETLTVNVDRTAPQLRAVLSPEANANGWNNAPVTVRYVSDDATSGVDTTSDDVEIALETAGRTVVGTSTDVAGNTTTVTTTIKLDATAPVVTAQLDPEPNADGWATRPVTVSFSGQDALSGIEQVSDPVTVDSDGAHTVTGYGGDLAGNRGEVSVSFQIDATAPSILLADLTDGAQLIQRPTQLRATLADAGSGLDLDSLSVEANGAGIPVTGHSTSDGITTLEIDPAAMPAGQVAISVRVSDVAGNAAEQRVSVQIDPVSTTTARQELWVRGIRATLAIYREEGLTNRERQDLQNYLTFLRGLRTSLGIEAGKPLFEDVRVLEEYLPAWLGVLGAPIGAEQVAELMDRLRADAEADAARATVPAPRTYASSLRASCERELRLERHLSRVLTPAQLDAYTRAVGGNPFYGERLRQLVVSGDDTPGAARVLAEAWRGAFDLGPASQAAAETHALELVQAIRDIPQVNPFLLGSGRRRASIAQVHLLLSLQAQAESNLASDPALTGPEQERARRGAPWMLRLNVGS